MKKYLNYFMGIIAGIGVLAIALTALANPSFFVKTAPTATATSTISYMTAGTATTTLTLDSYLIDQSKTDQNPTALDGLALAIQFHASSAPITTLKWRYQYSQDNQDWYYENTDLNINASTTNVVADFHEYSWLQISTSTAYSATGNSTSSLAKKIVDVPIKARYVRAQFYLPPASLNGGVWAEFIPKKQMSE